MHVLLPLSLPLCVCVYVSVSAHVYMCTCVLSRGGVHVCTYFICCYCLKKELLCVQVMTLTNTYDEQKTLKITLTNTYDEQKTLKIN